MSIYRESPETHSNELTGQNIIVQFYSIINTKQSQSPKREFI